MQNGAMTRKKLHFVQSLSRGLDVLEAFSAERPSLRLSDVAELTGLNMAAAQRFTDTLMQLGYLERDPSRAFSLGPKALSMGYAYLNGSHLIKAAQRILDRFARRHRRTVNLAVRDGEAVIFLHRREYQRFLKRELQAGSRLPAYCTATGKILLAALEDETLAALIADMRLERLTSRTIADAQELWDELLAVRAKGCAVSDRELSLAIYAVGAPLLDGQGRVVAAVAVCLPAADAAPALAGEMEEGICQVGRDISHKLGYQGGYPSLAPSRQPVMAEGR